LWNRVWRLVHTVAVAEETDNDTWKQQALEELRALAKNDVQTDSPDWVLVVDSLAQAFEGQKLSAETLAKYDEVIAAGAADGRCTYEYFMGVALEQQGDVEAADEYLRRAAFGGPFSNYSCTLAGHRLVERHGQDRGGMPERYEKQDAEAEAAWAKSLAESEGDDEGDSADKPDEDVDGEEPETDRTI
jgi:hypothetical protein